MGIPDTLANLNHALDNLAPALATRGADEVLAAETPLAAAVRALATLPSADRTDAVELRQTLIDVRVSLARCQALGSCSGQLESRMSSVSYGAHGTPIKAGHVASMSS